MGGEPNPILKDDLHSFSSNDPRAIEVQGGFQCFPEAGNYLAMGG